LNGSVKINGIAPIGHLLTRQPRFFFHLHMYSLCPYAPCDQLCIINHDEERGTTPCRFASGTTPCRFASLGASGINYNICVAGTGASGFFSQNSSFTKISIRNWMTQEESNNNCNAVHNNSNISRYIIIVI
jgi:hypothetical protein